ncbi:MAG: radical SAM protein [Paludibacteraceae bacterium]|nr:radical SAM protein [Paludibacteraceae bacterium]
MQQIVVGDLVVSEHKEQHYKTIFNKQTGFFARVEDKGFPEPFWSEHGPELLDISITNYCEKVCPFCYRQSNREGQHIKLSDFFNIVNQAKELGVLQIALGGGNPNQHPEFIKIIQAIRESGIVPSYTTNGMGLSDEILEATKKYCGAMALSIYTPFDENYYKQVIDRIKTHSIRFNLHIILKSDTLETITKWLQSFPPFFVGVNAIIFLSYKPIGGNRSLIVNDPLKWQNFFDAVKNCKSLKIGFDSCTVPGIVTYMKDVKDYLIEACEASRFSAFISEDLKMYPCSFMNGTDLYGDLNKQKIQEIWKGSDVFNNYRSSILNNKCNSCKFSEICMGGCQFLPEIRSCKS